MKVLIAAASFSSTISGVQRHALNVARCLLRLPEIAEVHLVVAPWQCNFAQDAGLPADTRLRTHIASIERDSLSRNLWYYRSLPGLSAALGVDMVHLSYPMPINRQAYRCPTVVTLHDLYPYEIPANFGFPKCLFNRAILRQCLRACDAIACVSDATVLRLKQYMPQRVWRKAARIYNCVEPQSRAACETPIRGKDQPFLLCVAQHRRNKNFQTLIRSFALLTASGWISAGTRLLVVGARGPETSAIRHFAGDRGVSGRIDFLEGISEPELQWCYRHCDALVAPSLTEGFNLPIAEALLAGCRIVCSDIPAHREVGGAHCRFFALGENAAENQAAAIADALDEPKPRSVRLPQFSAEVVSSEYLGLYRKLIASGAAKQSESCGGSFRTVSPVRVDATSPAHPSALELRGR